jgi:transmembrane sensor
MVEFDVIIKYFAGKATPEEAMEVDDWAGASNANGAFLKSTHQAWMAAGDEIYNIPNVANEWDNLKSTIQPAQVQPLKPAKNVWLSRAAALLAIVATAFAGYFVFNTKNQNLPTLTAEATDKKIELDLKDGTHVGIEKEGSLIYPVAFAKDKREVTLIGNGDFNVAHNTEQPFFVHMGGLHLKVLGTSFAITSSKEEVAVTVNKGLVAFYNSSDTLLISEGNIGKYIKHDKKFVLVQLTPEYGSFHFNDTPLKEVASQLSAHFKVNIQFTNPATGNCKMSAGFEHQTLKEILAAVSATFNIQYKMEGNKIHLSGNVCK